MMHLSSMHHGSGTSHSCGVVAICLSHSLVSPRIVAGTEIRLGYTLFCSRRSRLQLKWETWLICTANARKAIAQMVLSALVFMQGWSALTFVAARTVLMFSQELLVVQKYKTDLLRLRLFSEIEYCGPLDLKTKIAGRGLIPVWSESFARFRS